MFGFLKKKSPIDKLNKKYQDLMAESHRLSTIDRSASDAKFSEAQEILNQIDELSKKA